MLAGTDRAREFRAKVRQILKALRKGTIKAFKQVDPALVEARTKNAQARLLNANRKNAEFLIMAASKYKLSPVAAELIKYNALEMIVGKNTIPRPKIEKMYTASDIAKETGVSSNIVGRIANKEGIKTDEYGIIVLDQASHSKKQIEGFRYNERGRQKLLEMLKK